MRDREKQKESRKTPEGKAARKEESKKYRETRREELRRKSKEYAEKNADKIREYRKEYRKKNREKLKQKSKEYYRSLSPEKRAKFFKECQVRHSIRRKTNPIFRALCLARSRFWKSVRRGIVNGRTNHGFVKYFGCDGDTLKRHLESLFSEGMSWENYGKLWQIDHIVPLALSKGEEGLALKLNHFKNLRPLLATENRKKGDKLPEVWPEGVPFTREELGLSS